MKKVYIKLIAITLTLMLSVSIVVMSSYAWLVLSQSPAAEGIQITIAGGNTILVAADMTETEDGETYHYPGRFSDTLNFVQHDNYDYLSTIGGMTPVSTADGLNWYLPTYYGLSDDEVQSGAVLTGTLKDIEDFRLDEALSHANLGSDETKLIEEGSYVYVDFWVVSPGSNYTLRVSTGEDSNGSYAIGLMTAEAGEGGYTLVSGENDASAALRIGFLVNPDTLLDGTMERYEGSGAYSNMYTSLKGGYAERGGANVYSTGYRFTIYEPNGDSHPGGNAEEGSYVITTPVGLTDGAVSLVDIRDRLTVQLKNNWMPGQAGQASQIEQRFQTYLAGKSLDGLSGREISSDFYREYLDGQLAPYVLNGWFVKNTGELYKSAGLRLSDLPTVEEGDVSGSSSGGEESEAEAGQTDIPDNVVTSDFLSGSFTAGATDDVYIVELSENIPQRIRMFIWLEGQDVDCVNSISASELAISIELAGSNQDIN